MSTFSWTDRHGRQHHLEAPTAIDDEAEEIATEIDAHLPRARKGSSDDVRRAREHIRQLQARLDQLAEDGKRWNEFALVQARDEARRVSIAISDFLDEVPQVICPAALHMETREELSDPSTRAQLLSGPMTEWQQRAIEFSHLEPKPSSDATRGEALEWLNNDPAFFRPLSDEGGWFEWIDAEGVAQRLASPLQIETEIGNLADSLSELEVKMSEACLSTADLNEIVSDLEVANILFSRLDILQGDLERFAQEQIDQEEQEWIRYEQDWKAGRSKTE
ncbi:hypothetical protein [Porphyrobacter sp. YT40]|uniref:hypothetical protein n=1 Tax=Porphyrobacter sp. YT40 TaxID=2547601 RepID=UPI0011418AD1|nr:hypothetical protein [Porphyrobacter sp. YT40]QDH35120.1 hypothetical protein E2E27_12785 [Porphyrobacter sp. YT40]